MTWNQTLGLECRSADSYSTFGAYVQAQTDLFVESMQDAADNHWHMLSWRMEGASEEEIRAEMERWWNRHIRRFHSRHREEYRPGPAGPSETAVATGKPPSHRCREPVRGNTDRV